MGSWPRPLHRSRFARHRFCLLAVIAVVACGEEASGPPKSPEKSIGAGAPDFAAIAASEMAEAVAGRLYRDVEDDILRMEAKLPGFGGLFVDSMGTVVVYGPPNLSAEEVRAAMAEHASEFHLLPEHQEQLTTSDRVRVLPAQYSFSQLLAWQQGLASLGQPQDGIVGYDAHEGRNRVWVGVVNDAAAELLFARADAIGVPREIIETEVSGYPKSQSGVADSFLTSTVRPLRAGAEIGIQGGGWCTMGFLVKGPLGIPWAFLTAGHCTTTNGSTGNPVHQNGAGVAGTVYENRVFNIGHPACGLYVRCTRADVMVVRIADSLLFPLFSAGHSRWVTSGGSTKITGTSTITGEQAPYVGLSVTRVGKTTGTTTGVVDSMGFYTSGVSHTCIAKAFDAYNGHMNLCVTRVVNNGGGGVGDSGGPVVSGTKAVGILVGGTCDGGCQTYFNSLYTARSMVNFGSPGTPY